MSQIAGEDYVARLEVSVDDAIAVGGVEAFGQIEGNAASRCTLRRLAPKPVRQACPFDILHGKARNLSLIEQIENPANVGVCDAPRILYLGNEPAPDGRIGSQMRPDGLDGDPFVKAQIVGQVDLAHSSHAQQPFNKKAPSQALPFMEPRPFARRPIAAVTEGYTGRYLRNALEA